MCEKTDKDADAPAGWSKRVVSGFMEPVLGECWVIRCFC